MHGHTYIKFVENIKTHFWYSVTFLENRAVFEIMWKNILERGSPHDNKAHAHCMLDA